MYTAPDGTEYLVADAHAHIYKPKIAEKASQVIGEFYRTPMAVDDAISDKLEQQGDLIGTDRYLVCSAATDVRQVDSINRFIADECQAHPKFVGLGTSHQEVEDVDAVLDQVQALGLKGIKLHPDFQKFNIDDPRMMPLYRGAAKRGLIMMFHVGDERPEVDFSSPERLSRVLDQVPDLRCHAAHFGCCRQATMRPLPLMANQLAGADIMYDTSSTFAWYTLDELCDLIDLIGTDRLMWGTDFPMWDHREELKTLFDLRLGEEATRDLLYRNFAAFYDID